MEPVGLAFSVMEQAVYAVKSLPSTLSNYGSNPAYLDTIQMLADSLFKQLDTLESRFNHIAPSLTSLQLTCLQYQILTLNGHLGEVAFALVSLHEAITHYGYAWRRANHIAHELERLHDDLRDVQRDAKALHANLSTVEMSN
eukprot:GFKZ01003397.1.p1 GENE.GFKZ01003397.1~~GFKZ01003397.1.p1  ORF type:complete len:142 (+),score=6.93 GFKZ01003397.1:228-653(+)